MWLPPFMDGFISWKIHLEMDKKIGGTWIENFTPIRDDPMTKETTVET
jgi:hypothetical protein